VAGVRTGDDETGTGREQRLARVDVGSDLVGEPLALEMGRDRRRFTAGQQEEIAVGDRSRRTDLDRVGALAVGTGRPLDGRRVLPEITLDNDDAGGETHVVATPPGEKSAVLQ